MDADGFLTPVESSKTSQETEVGCLAFKLLIAEANLARLLKRRQWLEFLHTFSSFQGHGVHWFGRIVQSLVRLQNCRISRDHEAQLTWQRRALWSSSSRTRGQAEMSSRHFEILHECPWTLAARKWMLTGIRYTVQNERLQWFSKAMSCSISLQCSAIGIVSDAIIGAGFAGCW